MVLEKLISDQLNKFLGTFVEGIDSKQLGASIMSGSLRLENMKLRPDIFDDSPMPFSLDYGQVGKIYIKIPIWDMFASPMIINIENVFGLAKIKKIGEWKTDLQKEAFKIATQDGLEQFELLVKQKEIFKQTQKESQGNSFVEGIVASIIDNIQISIKNVYFRFEDDLQGQKTPFAIGMKLKEFSITTTDDSSFTSKKSGSYPAQKKEQYKKYLTYKKAMIRGFSIFCDYDEIHLRSNGGVNLEKLNKERALKKSDTESHFKQILNGEFGDNPKELAKHKYMMENFEVTLKLQFNKDIKNPAMPGTLAIPQIESIVFIGEERDIQAHKKVLGADGQYHGDDNALSFKLYQPQIIRVLRTLETIGFFNEFKEGALLEFFQREITQEENLQYQKDYLNWRLLEDSKDKSDKNQSEFLIKQMKNLEDQCSLPAMIELRNEAISKIDVMVQDNKNNEVDEELEKRIQQEVKKQTGWFSSSDTIKQIEEKVRKEAEVKGSINKLMDQFNNLKKGDLNESNYFSSDKQNDTDKSMQENTLLPKDYLQFDLELVMCEMNFMIVNEFDQQLFEFMISEFLVSHQQSHNITRSMVLLDDFEIRDEWSGSKIYKYLVEAKEQNIDMMHNQIKFDYPMAMVDPKRKYSFLPHKDHQNPQALIILFETGSNELEQFKAQDYNLVVRVQKPLHIIPILPLINELQRTMEVAFEKQALDFSYFEQALTRRQKKMRQEALEAAENIKNGKYEHISVQVDLAMNAPLFIIPENMYTKQNYINLDTGFITIKSHLVPYDKSKNYHDCFDEEMLYDRYEISLQKMSLSLKNDTTKTSVDIIKEYSYDVAIDNCLEPLHQSFPSVRLFVDFDQEMDFDVELETINHLLLLKDKIIVQLERKDVKIVEDHFKNKAAKNILHQLSANVNSKMNDLLLQRQSTMGILDKDQMANIRQESQQRKEIFEQVKSNQNSLRSSTIMMKDSRQASMIDSNRLASTLMVMKTNEETSEKQSDQEDQTQNLQQTNLELNVNIKKICINLRGPKTEIDFKELERKQKLRNQLKMNFEIPNQKFQQISFVMEKLATRVYKDLSKEQVDFSIQTLAILEGSENIESQSLSSVPEDPQDSVVQEDFETIVKNNREMQLLKRIMSSPYDDQTDKDEAEMVICNSEKYAFESVPQNPNQKLAKEEKQLMAQVISHVKESFDEKYDAPVEETDREIFVVINRSRLIVNLTTVANLLVVSTQFMHLMDQQTENFDRHHLENMMQLTSNLRSKVTADKKASHQDEETNILVKRIYSNMAQTARIDTDEYMEEALQRLESHIQKEIIIQKIKFEGSEEAQIRLSSYQMTINKDGKIEESKKDEETTSFQEKKIKFMKEDQIDSATQSSTSRSKINFVKEKISKAVKLVSKTYEEKDLRIVDMNHMKERINLQVKMKNMELWVSDFKQENQMKKAQILQLKFLSDLSVQKYDYRANLKCIQPNSGADSSLLDLFITIENHQQVQMNVDELSIEHLLVDRWIDVPKVVLHLFEKHRDSEVEVDDKVSQNPYEFKINKNMDYEDEKSEDDFSSYSLSSDHHLDFKFKQCKILIPTSVGICQQARQTFKKIRMVEVELDISQFLLTLDFKDIEFLLYLNKRFEDSILPELEKMSKTVQDNINTAEQSRQEDKKEGADNVNEIDQDIVIQKIKKSENTIDVEFMSQEDYLGADTDQLQQIIENLEPPKVNQIIDTSIQDGPQEKFKTDIENMVVRIESMIISLNDGEISTFMGDQDVSKPTPLVEFALDSLILHQNITDVQNFDDNPFMGVPNERYFYFQRFLPPYKELGAQVRVFATYYNELSQAYEPFIEPWQIEVGSTQTEKDAIMKHKIQSETMLEINLSTGMAVSVNNIKERVLKSMEKLEKLDQSKTKKQITIQTLNDQEQIMSFQTNKLSTLQNSLRYASTFKTGTAQKKNQNGYAFANHTGSDMVLSKSSDNQLSRDLNQVKLPGFGPNEHVKPEFVPSEFFDMKVMRKKRKQSKVMQQPQFYVKDYVEELPINIDFEIGQQLISLERCQIDNIGIYSFRCKIGERPNKYEMVETANEGCCIRTNNMNGEDDDSDDGQYANMVVNIKTDGIEKIISFESQLLVSNNLLKPIVLVFHLKNMNDSAKMSIRALSKLKRYKSSGLISVKGGHRSKKFKQKKNFDFDGEELDIPDEEPKLSLQRDCSSMASSMMEDPFKKDEGYVCYIEIERQDVFRVPLIWMMPNSEVDIYILEETLSDTQELIDFNEEKKIPLINNIGQVFNKCAKDIHKSNFDSDLQSKFIELNKDFYISMDIQAYGCLPRISHEKNPLQYVLSFNPPLMLTNFCMNSLKVFEIDDPKTKPIEKTISEISPSHSQYLIELDITRDNDSAIKLEINDTEMNAPLTAVIKDNDLDFYLTSQKQYLQKVEVQSHGRYENNRTKQINQYVRTENQAKSKNEAVLKTLDFRRKGNDGASDENCLMQMETVKIIYKDLKAYDWNFAQREIFIDKSISSKIMVYPKYMIVNKTEYDILYLLDKKVPKMSNDFIICNREFQKMKFRVKNYNESQEIDLRNVGVPQGLKMDDADPLSSLQLQFGVSIAPAESPFTKTTLITIVPQYLLVNNLKAPIRVRQVLNGNVTGNEIIVENSLENTTNKQEFHLNRSLTAKKCCSRNKQTKQANLIQFQGIFEDLDSFEFADSIAEDENRGERADIEWGIGFNPNDAVDFQTEQKIKSYSRPKEWYEPSPENNFKLTSRIIVQPNPLDNGATQLIMFNDPPCPDLQIHNDCDDEFYFVKVDGAKEFGKRTKIEPGEKMPFVWDNNNQQKKLKLFIGHMGDQQQMVSLDKVNKEEWFQVGDTYYCAKVYYNEECTKEILIKQELDHDKKHSINKIIKNSTQSIVGNKKKDKKKLTQTSNQDDSFYDKEFTDSKKFEGHDFDISLRGFGISFIDNDPKPIIYMRVEDLGIKLIHVEMEKDDNSTVTETKLLLQMWSFQVDNMNNQEMPVLLGAKNYYGKTLVKSGEAHDKRDFFRVVNEKQLKRKNKQGYHQNVPFMLLKVELSEKKYQGSRGSIKRFENVKFGIQEFFVSVEEKVLNSSLKFFQEIDDIFSSKYQMQNEEEHDEIVRKLRKEICPMVDASQGVVVDEDLVQVEKVSFGTIWITAIKVSLTCHVKLMQLNFDLSDTKSALFSIFNIVKPFINQLASITDSIIKLNELMIIEGCVSQEKLIAMISQHVMYSVIGQIYKLLGSSDLIGNPVRLIDKVGTGFYQLARDPLQGLSEGSPSEFLKGIGSGVQGVVRGVVGGFFQSTAQLSNSLYEILKETTGQDLPNRQRIDSLPGGLYYGVKGFIVELVYGITGIVMRPYQGYKQSDSFRGFIKGFGQGALGCAISPITGLTRSLNLVSLGLAIQAIHFSNMGLSDIEKVDPKLVWARPRRRIEVRGQIKTYSQDIALINQLLVIVGTEIRFLQNQQMRFYAVLPKINKKGHEIKYQKCILLITTDYIMFLQVPNFFRMQKDQKIIFSESLLFCEKLSNILFYTCQKNQSKNRSLYFLQMLFKNPYKKQARQQRRRQVQNQDDKNALTRMKILQAIPEVEETKVLDQQSDQTATSCANINLNCFTQPNNPMKEQSIDLRAPLLPSSEQISSPDSAQIDTEASYEYIFYSPCQEILNRVHTILQTVPEVQNKFSIFS